MVAGPALALGATSVFYSLDYSHASPMFLSVLAILFIGATAHRVRRSLLIGVMAIATALAQHAITEGLAGLNTALLANIGWITSAVLAGHSLAAQRDYMAAMRDRALRAEETRELEAERRVTEERLRIARELHNVVSHTISVINVQAGVAADVIQQRPEQALTALTSPECGGLPSAASPLSVSAASFLLGCIGRAAARGGHGCLWHQRLDVGARDASANSAADH